MDNATNNMRIDILPNGPYKVSGGVPLVSVEIVVDDQGDSVGFRETNRFSESRTNRTYLLCRCGRSGDRPFCDGSHSGCFHDATTASEASKFEDKVEGILGDGIELLDANTFCIGARFCDRAGSVWSLTDASKRPDASPDFKETAITEAKLCPSGRLVMIDLETKEVLEPEIEPSIAVLEDPSRESGCALWVRGGIPVYGPDGEPFELRNRVTLCRCGMSRNKPFCDGSHYAIDFKDKHTS